MLIGAPTSTTAATTDLGVSLSLGAASDRLARAAGWSLAGAALGRILSLASTVGASRILGDDFFGRLGFVQNTVGVYASILGAAVAVAATKRVADFARTDAAQASDQARHDVLVGIAAGLLSGVSLLASAPVLAGTLLGDRSLTEVLMLSAPLVACSVFSTVTTGVLAGFERFRLIAGLTAIRGVVLLPALVLGAWAGALGGALVGLTAAEAVTAAAGYMMLARQLVARGRVARPLDRSRFAELWRLTLPVVIGTIATNLSIWYATAVLVTREGGYPELGHFIAADRWRQLLLFIPSCIAPVMLPLLSSLHATRDTSGYRRVFSIAVTVNVALVTLGVLALLPFAREEMRLFGPEYEGGGNVLRLLLIGTIPVVLNTILGQVLVSLDRIWWRCLADVLLAVLLALAAWALIPRFQAAGLATAHLISFGVVATALFFAARIRLDQEQASPAR